MAPEFHWKWYWYLSSGTYLQPLGPEVSQSYDDSSYSQLTYRESESHITLAGKDSSWWNLSCIHAWYQFGCKYSTSANRERINYFSFQCSKKKVYMIYLEGSVNISMQIWSAWDSHGKDMRTFILRMLKTSNLTKCRFSASDRHRLLLRDLRNSFSLCLTCQV